MAVCRWRRPQGRVGDDPSGGEDHGHGDAAVQVRPAGGAAVHGQVVQRAEGVLQVHPEGAAQHASVPFARDQCRCKY